MEMHTKWPARAREGFRTMIEVGDKMPEFSLRDAEREEVTQQHFDGTIAVIAFYALAFTGG